MNKRAMSDYDALEFELARKTLMDAVSLLRQAGMDESSIAAKTYMNLGVVYVAGFKDRNRGMQQFVQALKVNSALKLDPAVASPELDEVFTAARKQVGGSGSTSTSVPELDENDKPNDAKGLQHVPADEARPGEPLLIKAQLGSDAGATKMFVLYRASGQSDYTTLPMKSGGGGEWSASIPGDVIEDRPLQYYVEARDKKGRVVLNSGSAPSPFIVTISEVAPGARIVRRDQPKSSKAQDPNHYHRMFLNVMPGFGFGVHPAGHTTEVAYQKYCVTSCDGATPTVATVTKYRPAAVDHGGAVVSPFHIAVELGGNITRNFSLSLMGRFQVVTGANAQTLEPSTGAPANQPTTRSAGAVAGFVRAKYRFPLLHNRLHPYLHVDVGGGEIRDALDMSGAQKPNAPLVDFTTADAYNRDANSKLLQLVCADPTNCYDTLRLGYVFVGGGAGISYDVWKYIAVMLDVNLLGAIRIGDNGQSGFHADFQLGVGAHFL